ncbi:hypothetical protein Goshw_022281 [Gossypium schwendimanii]|uniref:Uncharacterized protein n=1 Tax=Gossypium schwendimanii TaxID=34291 RepID=A0A7J9MP12_GOSSC|nr:hypothetical protein [Gossypium schwendimanii]
MAPSEKSLDLKYGGKEILVGEDSVKVPLKFFNHLLVFYRLQPTAKQLGDFVGEFLEYGSKSLSTSLRSFILIRVLLDVRRSLKRKKRIMCMLGINLDEDVRDTFDMVGNMIKNKGHVDMDHDGEENPIEGGEGN